MPLGHMDHLAKVRARLQTPEKGVMTPPPPKLCLLHLTAPLVPLLPASPQAHRHLCSQVLCELFLLSQPHLLSPKPIDSSLCYKDTLVVQSRESLPTGRCTFQSRHHPYPLLKALTLLSQTLHSRVPASALPTCAYGTKALSPRCSVLIRPSVPTITRDFSMPLSLYFSVLCSRDTVALLPCS